MVQILLNLAKLVFNDFVVSSDLFLEDFVANLTLDLSKSKNMPPRDLESICFVGNGLVRPFVSFN